MNNRYPRIKKQMGSVLALVAVASPIVLASIALSVDIGFFYVVRGELQNAVDSAALAGAQGLAVSPRDQTLARQLAGDVAVKNLASGQPVVLSSNEVTFPDGNSVRVEITRPAQTFFARLMGVSQVSIRVSAEAVAVPVASVSGGPGGGGMRPWAILDQFGHGALCVPPNDADVNSPAHGPFKSQPHTWMGVTVSSDLYTSPYDPSFDGWDLSRESDCGSVTGFIAPRDVNGQVVRLKQFGNGGGNGNNGNGNGNGNNGNGNNGNGNNGNGNNGNGNGGGSPWLTPGNFGALALGSRGGSTYQNNIANGYAGTVHIGDRIETEPGNMVGPTVQGVVQLIAQDPSAYVARNSSGDWVVKNSNFSANESPRIVPIPLYSVYTGPGNGRSEIVVASIASFFIDGTDGFDVWGRFIQTRSKYSQPGEPVNGGSQTTGGGGRLLATVRLIE